MEIGVPHTHLSACEVDLLYSILERFDKATYQVGLRYSIACGTALGAILRGGLIPWDTDADLFVIQDHFNLSLLNSVLKNSLVIESYNKWSDGRGWYKIYDVNKNYPNIDIYLLNYDNGVWRPTDPAINWRKQIYLDPDQIVFNNRVPFGDLCLPIFNYPLRFLDRCYPDWRNITNETHEKTVVKDFRLSLRRLNSI